MRLRWSLSGFARRFIPTLLKASAEAKRRFFARLRRKLLVESLEERRVMATLYVNDNWNFVSDADNSGSLTTGDVISNANDGGTTQYTIGTDAVFGVVTTGTATGNLPAGATIQSAVNAAATGDTIGLNAGNYTSESTITIADKSVTVAGPQAGQSPTTAAGAWADESALAVVGRFNVTGTGGLTVNGLRLVGAAGGGDDDSAIIMLGTGGLSVTNSLISVAAGANKRGTGIDVSSQDTAITVSHSLFTGFTSTIAPDNGWGIYLNYGSATVKNVSITNNVFDMAGDVGAINGTVPGIPIGFDGYMTSKGTLSIQNNTFRDTAPWYAIGALDWSGQVSSSTTFADIANNTFSNAAAAMPYSDTGVFRNRTGYVTTTGSNTVDGKSYDQLLTGANAAASTLTGSAGTDYIAGQGLNDRIEGQDGNDMLLGNSGDDTLIGGAGTNTIDGGAGIDTAIFDGSASNYTIVYGASNVTVTSNAGFTPASVNTLTNTEILQFANDTARILIVGPNSAFTTIQAAVTAAAAGDTVRVLAGTYAEQVSIGKQLSLIGPNATVAGTGTRNAEAIVTGGFVINGSSATNVTIAGFSVTGANVASSRGILLGNTNAVAGPVAITNNIIENWTTGISLGGGATAGWVNDVAVSGNLIRGNTAGIGSTENVNGLAVTNNTFSGNDEGIGLGPGLVDFSATGNTFSSDNTVYIASYATGLMPSFATLYSNNTFANRVEVSPAIGGVTSAIYSNVAQGIANAASNATVNVNAGTYTDGNVTVNATGLTVSAPTGVSGFSLTLGSANDLTLTGAAHINIVGNANVNTLSGNDGNNVLTPLAGADTINANSGDDTVIYQSQSDAAGDQLDGGAGTNTILFTSTTASEAFVVPSTFTNIQIVKAADASGATTGTAALSLDGSAISAGLTLVGNDGANTLLGGDGNDTLTGNGGNDRLEAGAGTNTINGGSGVDTAIFAGSASNYTIVYNASTVTVTSNVGFTPASSNTLTYIEVLKFNADSGSLLVVGPNSVFSSLQMAVDAATAGDTILIVADDFEGNVSIDKSLTIRGANAGLAGTASNRTAESVVKGFVDVTSDASTITFDGLRFEPFGTSAAWGGTNLRSAAANTVLRNSVVVTGLADTYANSGNAVTLSGATVTVEDNRFTNSVNPTAQPNLLEVSNTTSGITSVLVNRNTFTHSGTTDKVSTIALVGQYGTVTVTNNTITGGGNAL
ncbi:MAG: hypothetical protein ACKO38_16910, partial [Planctomycetota bacterium]